MSYGSERWSPCVSMIAAAMQCRGCSQSAEPFALRCLGFPLPASAVAWPSLIALALDSCSTCSALLGNVYPAYASYKAVLSRDPEEHKQWLCYWVVAALFVVVELVGDVLISWLPLYYESKLALLAWLTLGKGATVLYDSCVQGYLERYEPEIDAKLQALQASADAAIEGLKSRAVKHIRHGSRTILQAGGAALAELAMATATTAALEDGARAAAAAAAARARGGEDEQEEDEGRASEEDDEMPAGALFGAADLEPRSPGGRRRAAAANKKAAAAGSDGQPQQEEELVSPTRRGAAGGSRRRD